MRNKTLIKKFNHKIDNDIELIYSHTLETKGIQVYKDSVKTIYKQHFNGKLIRAFQFIRGEK